MTRKQLKDFVQVQRSNRYFPTRLFFVHVLHHHCTNGETVNTTKAAYTNLTHAPYLNETLQLREQ